MENPWIAYRPSIYHLNASQTTIPDSHSQTIIDAIAKIQNATKDLQLHPYDARLWAERAGHLLRLGYPELAVGDAWKAKLLVERKDEKETQNGDSTHDASGDTTRFAIYQILITALFDAHCHSEAYEISEEASKLFPDNGFFSGTLASLKVMLGNKSMQSDAIGGTTSEKRDRIRDGGVKTIMYPWMQERHRRRNEAMVEGINRQFVTGDAPFKLSHSRIASPEDEDFLGILATKAMEAGETVVIDRTPFGASNTSPEGVCANCYKPLTGCPFMSGRFMSPCCNKTDEEDGEKQSNGFHASHADNKALLQFCTEGCFNIAAETNHRTLCKQDFSWLLDSSTPPDENSSVLRSQLMLRVLAACAQEGTEKHPLDHPLVARFVSQTGNDHVDVFTLQQSIIQPIRILEQLGIDPYANPNFDTWALHTIWTRLANNKHGFSTSNAYVDCLGPLFALFNHSCEPNVRYVSDGGTTVRFIAMRDIKQGEELFNSYRNVENMGVDERTEVLWPWFEGPCRCNKCGRERGNRAVWSS